MVKDYISLGRRPNCRHQSLHFAGRPLLSINAMPSFIWAMISFALFVSLSSFVYHLPRLLTGDSDTAGMTLPRRWNVYFWTLPVFKTKLLDFFALKAMCALNAPASTLLRSSSSCLHAALSDFAGHLTLAADSSRLGSAWPSAIGGLSSLTVPSALHGSPVTGLLPHESLASESGERWIDQHAVLVWWIV